MTIEWIWMSIAMLCVVVAILYVTHMLDERKWARDEKRRAEWERTHPAE